MLYVTQLQTWYFGDINSSSWPHSAWTVGLSSC